MTRGHNAVAPPIGKSGIYRLRSRQQIPDVTTHRQQIICACWHVGLSLVLQFTPDAKGDQQPSEIYSCLDGFPGESISALFTLLAEVVHLDGGRTVTPMDLALGSTALHSRGPPVAASVPHYAALAVLLYYPVTIKPDEQVHRNDYHPHLNARSN